MCKGSFGGQRLPQGHMWFADGIEPMSSVVCSTSGPVPGRPEPLDGLLLHQSSAVTRRSDGVLMGLDHDEEQGNAPVITGDPEGGPNQSGFNWSPPKPGPPLPACFSVDV